MTERISRQIVLAARPQGRVQLSDFRVKETTVPVPGASQILLAVEYLSLIPTCAAEWMTGSPTRNRSRLARSW